MHPHQQHVNKTMQNETTMQAEFCTVYALDAPDALDVEKNDVTPQPPATPKPTHDIRHQIHAFMAVIPFVVAYVLGMESPEVAFRMLPVVSAFALHLPVTCIRHALEACGEAKEDDWQYLDSGVQYIAVVFTTISVTVDLSTAVNLGIILAALDTA